MPVETMEPHGGGDRKKSVLVVDDAQENIDVLKGILSEHYEVKVATSGRLALKVAFSPKPPDLILLDVMMPEMDGYEVCRLLKADDRTRNIPVIFVTAKSEVEDEAYGFSLGAADYITKPVSASIVLARVKTHLDLYDHSRHLETLVQEQSECLIDKANELRETRLEIIRRLGRAAEYRDEETGMHVIRMSQYTRLLAKKAGLSDFLADQLMDAALLHDVGKMGIPDHILLKPGKLTEEEFEVVKKHPQIGAEIIGEHQSDLLKLSRVVALTHHEKWNGRGYPYGLKGEEIPLSGRIAAVADIFDTLTSERPYKKAWTVDEALALLEKEAGEALDPNLVPHFIDLRPEVEKIMRTFEELPDLPGVNVVEGVRRMGGSVATYYAVLEKFRRNQSQTAAEIREALSDVAWGKAERLACFLAGGCCTLGGGDIQEQARELEAVIREGREAADIEPLLPPLERALSRLFAAVDRVVEGRRKEMDKAQEPLGASLDMAALTPLIARARVQLEEFDSGVEETVAKMRVAAGDDAAAKTALDWLEHCLDSYDYERGLTELMAWANITGHLAKEHAGE